jgi:predicted DNA-binding WGR domain protein
VIVPVQRVCRRKLNTVASSINQEAEEGKKVADRECKVVVKEEDEDEEEQTAELPNKSAARGRKRKAVATEEKEEENMKPKKAMKVSESSIPAPVSIPTSSHQNLRATNSVYLECKDGSSNKFYQIALTDTQVTSRYGKIGASGQETVKSFDTVARAEAFYTKTLNEKKGKGYKECR